MLGTLQRLIDARIWVEQPKELPQPFAHLLVGRERLEAERVPERLAILGHHALDGEVALNSHLIAIVRTSLLLASEPRSREHLSRCLLARIALNEGLRVLGGATACPRSIGLGGR